jgi:pyrroline-5-carboxylate reductase
MKNTKETIRVGILGLGNMGQAIFGLLKNHSPFSQKAKFSVCSLGISRFKGATCVKNKEDLFEKCDLVFLSVKPQEFYQMEFQNYFRENNPVLISIMAGVNLKNIKKITGCRKAVRAMPNLPLQIGKGLTGWHANKNEFKKNELRLIESVFSCFGKSLFVSNEEKIDAVTAVSGSGPAYVFLFINALAKSAMKLGFSRSQAEGMALETASGSIEYLRHMKGKYNISCLIEKVKSKKGTTEAALEELNVANFYKKWESAVKKAHSRSKEISSYEIR